MKNDKLGKTNPKRDERIVRTFIRSIAYAGIATVARAYLNENHNVQAYLTDVFHNVLRYTGGFMLGGL